METVLNREQISVLIALLKNNMNTELNSRARDEMLELVKKELAIATECKCRLNDRRLRTKLNELFKLGYIAKGVKTSKLDAYYITKLGIEKVNTYKRKKEDK